MQTLLVEPIGGASGNMLLGAFFDLGLPINSTLEFLKSLELGNWEFLHNRVVKLGVEGQWCDFRIDSQQSASINNNELLNYCQRLPKPMESKASLILKKLLEAEGGASPTHTRPAAAAIDLCLDVFGFLFCWSQLDYCPIWVSPLPLGQGLCRYHGQLWPNPSPVVTKLLQGFPQYRLPIHEETITATGAAILSSLASPLPNQAFVVHQSGYGAGQSDFPMSNVVRLSKASVPATETRPEPELVQLDCDLDDMTGEQLANLTDRLILDGAVDAQLISFLGKKGRPGHRLSCLVARTQLDQIGLTLFQNSTTLGYRWHPVSRCILERRIEEVQSPLGTVRRKVAHLPDGSSRWKWEHADIEKLAQQQGLTELQVVQRLPN